MLISCAVTAQLICAFVFAYAKIRFSGDEAHLMLWELLQVEDIRSDTESDEEE